jgi:hypothetical protein
MALFSFYVLALFVLFSIQADAFSVSYGLERAFGAQHTSGYVNRRRFCSTSIINLSGVVKSSTVVDKADAWLREQTL